MVFQWEALTGGSNGVIGVWPPPPFDKAWVYFLLSLVLAVIGVLMLRRFFVRALRLCDACGPRFTVARRGRRIDVKRVHWLGFAIAGAVCGVAGGLFAFAKGSISPETIHVGRSIDGLVMGAARRHPDADRADRRGVGLCDIAGHGHAPDRVLAGPARHYHSASRAGFSARYRRRLLLGLAQNGSEAVSVLAIHSLSKAFGGVHAVNKVSFEIAQGEFLAMIGPNGAGKSTCFNMINGQLTPDSGEIFFEGRNIAGLEPRAVWRLGVGRTFQVAATFSSMTVIENVQMALISHGHETYQLWRAAAQMHT